MAALGCASWTHGEASATSFAALLLFGTCPAFLVVVQACLWQQRLKVELLLQVDITIEEDVEDPTKAPAK